MSKIIKVGHSDNMANHIKINDKSVSRDHLEVRKIDDNTLHIKDIDSRNGTKIDGIEIVESSFKISQNIQIGHQIITGDEFFIKVGRFFMDKRVHWVNEFKALEIEFKKYDKKKSKLNQNFQNKMNYLRAGLAIGIAAIFYFAGQHIGVPSELRFITSIGGGMIAGLIVPILITKDNLMDELMKVRREYSRILLCPRCKRDISGAPYKYWKEEKRCTSCDAIWVE